MAISEEKTRMAISMPKWVAELIRKEAKNTGLTVSQYVTLTMVANSYLGDERAAQLAANQLEVAHALELGLELSEFQRGIPKLI